MPAHPAAVALQTLPISDLGTPSAVLRIRGPDSNTFLQGQFTQDLRMPVGGCAYGLWLSQKGKTLADSFVLRVAEQEFLLWSARVSRGVIRERLEGYLIADDVEILEPTADPSGALVIWGAQASAAVKERCGVVPGPGRFVTTPLGLIFRGRFSAKDNFVCLTDALAEATRAFEQSGSTAGTSEALEAERIFSALPAVPDDIGANDLPNEGGLDVDAISYTKGCYLGQEVMARLKNLGQVRRRLFVIEGDGPPPMPHTPLRQGDKQVGETRSRAGTGERFVAIAMLSLVNFDRAVPLLLPDGRSVLLRHG